ncbi:MAG: type I polyketide synthase, partial [Vicinamibacterales bacterium]
MGGADQMKQFDGSEIAIIGLAGRFPGARTVDAFWQNLRDGVESITRFSDEQLLAAGVDPALLSRLDYVKAGAVLEGAEWFDAAFFGFSPREAEILDPQHRLFLECAWEALEVAGYDPSRSEASIGVFAGAGRNVYYEHNLRGNLEAMSAGGGYEAALGNETDFLTTRVAYKLNLKGPSLSIQTSCSTSLVAVHVACQHLMMHQCDLALAGGVFLGRLPVTGYVYQPGAILSPDGHCRAFDAKASGAVAGRGVGLVVLKRLSEALRDGDTIRAVVRGSAINNDGSTKVSYTAPSVAGQAEVIAEALAVAGVPAESIGLVEAHGTGTPLGDPAEVAALTKVFRAETNRRGFCALGSLKTNIGHLDVAAGVSGLIKAVLALEHKQLPPSLHYHAANPEIDFANGPFFVNTKLRAWDANGHPRRAAVSSFGIGGTNAHVVLEEAPLAERRPAAARPHALVLSARTRPGLESATDNLADHLAQHAADDLGDAAFTLQTGRRVFEHRRAVVCDDPLEAADALKGRDASRVWTGSVGSSSRSVLFIFPASSDDAAAARALYEAEPAFAERFDACRALFPDAAQIAVDTWLRGGEIPVVDAVSREAASFAAEYALAGLFERVGIRPSASVGDGVGELVAGCVAGAITLEDAWRLLTARADLRAGGSSAATALIASVAIHTPASPVLRWRTGARLAGRDAADVRVWVDDDVAAGREADPLGDLLAEEPRILIEIGLGESLMPRARARLSANADHVALSLASHAPGRGIRSVVLDTIARTWIAGCDVDWHALHASEERRRVPLPTYPFERQRFWIEP